MPLAKYQDMKDSGVPWLQEIPAAWDLKPAKYLFLRSSEQPQENDAVVTAFRDGEVVLRSKRREDGFTFADKEIGYQHVSIGDLVIHAMDGFAGAIGVSKSNGKMSPVCSICKPIDDSIDSNYYAYLLRAMTKTNYLIAIAKGIRERSTDFRYKDFGNMLLPILNIDTQQSIVKYVDEETLKIDNLIAKQEKLLQLLEEKRRATITHAVTRGLNPKAELKQTQIPWLPQIPKHWEVMRLKDTFTDNDESLSQNTAHDYEFDYVDISSVDKYLGIIKRETMTFDKAPSRARRVVKQGDIIIGAVRTYLEAIAQITDDEHNLIVSTGFVVLRPKNIVDTDYYFYALRAGTFMASIVSNSDGVSYPAINADKLMALHIVVPPESERQTIMNKCRSEMDRIDCIKQKIQTQINLLNERRTSLISHAVTGKINI